MSRVEDELGPEKNYEFNSWLRRSIASRACKVAEAGADSESWQSVQAVWDATIKEVQEGWSAGGPPVQESGFGSREALGMSARELERHPWICGKSYRLIRRFGVF